MKVLERVEREIKRAVASVIAPLREDMRLVETTLRQMRDAYYTRPHVVSVLVIGTQIDSGPEPFYASWSAELQPGNNARWDLDVYRPVARGAWVIGLNGALLENVLIGDMHQGGSAYDCGPVVKTRDAIMPGMRLVVHVRTEARKP